MNWWEIWFGGTLLWGLFALAVIATERKEEGPKAGGKMLLIAPLWPLIVVPLAVVATFKVLLDDRRPQRWL